MQTLWVKNEKKSNFISVQKILTSLAGTNVDDSSSVVSRKTTGYYYLVGGGLILSVLQE